MELTKCKLGELITQRREKNDGSDLPICGVSKDGLIPPKQKDADTSIYNVFYRDDFIFNPARMELNSIAINDMYDRAICSSLYEVFYVHRTDLLLPHYLKLIIRQKWFTRYCEFLGQGSAREYCRFGNISEIEIEFPPIKEQQKIVGYNTAIENRIALKQKINDNLDDTAQTLYQKYFESNSDKSSWKQGTVGDVLQLQRGHDLPRTEMTGGKYPVAGSTGTIGYHDEFTAEAPVIVMGRSGNIGNPRLYLCNCWTHNTSLYVKQIYEAEPLWVFYLLKNLNYDGFVGGSAVPTLNRNDVHAYGIAIPPLELQKSFSQKVMSLIYCKEENLSEIEKLQELQKIILTTMSSR